MGNPREEMMRDVVGGDVVEKCVPMNSNSQLKQRSVLKWRRERRSSLQMHIWGFRGACDGGR